MLCGIAFAQDATPPAPAAPFVEVTPELDAAVELGLASLALQQEPDGSFNAEKYGNRVGITAIAGIAFLAHGDLPGRGPYGANVQKALHYILASAKENGLISADASHGPMYGHGFATLFLAEVYGQTSDARTREVLVDAVKLIIDSQNQEGGWRYQPVPVEADISVTICQVMALRAARNAGIKVPKETIDRAVEYVRRCQNPDGGFRYMINSGNSAFPRSAAGVATLYYAGIYQDEAIDRGLAYLNVYIPGGNVADNTPHYYYGQYYAVQTMYMAGGENWTRWFAAIRTELLTSQDKQTGLWSGEAGEAYGTAMACIILQVPYRYLPIFQK